MKTIDEFLTDLYRLDVKLWVEGDRLRCRAPEEVLTPALSAQLQARKAELIDFLTQAHLALQASSQPIQPISREGHLPLSFAQQRLWFLEQLQPGSSVYNIPAAVRLQGVLDVTAFEESFNEIVRRHEILRTNFTTLDGQPVQVIAPTLSLNISLVNLRQLSLLEQEAEILQLATQEAHKPFNLAKDPLLRVTLLHLNETEYVVLLTLHHIIADGWSMEVLIRELTLLYQAFSTDKPSPLSDLPIQYADFAAWQRQWLLEVGSQATAAGVATTGGTPATRSLVLGSQRHLYNGGNPNASCSWGKPPRPHSLRNTVTPQVEQVARKSENGRKSNLEALLDYWKKQLADLPILQLPTDFPRTRVQSFRGANQTFSLSPNLTEQLKALSQREGITLFMTLLAAYKVLLYRYSEQEDIIVGSPIANRNRTEIEALIGFFVNTLVLRTNLAGNPTFREVLSRVRKVTWEAYDRQDLPFEKLVEELQPERDLSYNPLFQVKFRLENAPTEAFKLPGLTLSSLKQANSSAKLDLSLDMYEAPSGLVGGFEYNKDLFAPDTISCMVGNFCTLLEGIVNAPDQRISELPLLAEAERHQLLVEWNETETDYAQELCFHQLFETQVEKTPDAVALIFEAEQLTYQELNRRSNQLAHYLQQLGVKPEVKVGICIERSPEMIIALLGILKAGGAYVPLDPAYPKERLAFMLSDSQVAVLLTESGVGSRESGVRNVIYLDTDWEMIATESAQNPVSGVTTENLAYLIYTSGSTGIPKGVLVNHAGLVNLTEDKIRVCGANSDSCVLQLFSLSFDASIPEIIMALGCGGKLCLAKLESLLPGPALLKLLREQAVTHITITPSALATLPFEDLPALRMVLVGGEAPSANLIENWSKGRRFINAYGPTEVTVNASMVQCGNGQPILPTLRPSANKQLYILDRHLQPVPIGVLGELYIGGIGLARGYLNCPDKTAEAFIPNPFVRRQEAGGRGQEEREGRGAEGQRRQGSRVQPATFNLQLYKTGDLACYLADGRIKLFGRIDNQVKIRGFRIEPGEIEALLSQHPQVQTCVVTVREDNPGDKRLIAYFVPEPEVVVSNELRRFLREKLPEYMIPSAFVELETLPLTPNGKVDHRALPLPDKARASSERIWIAPRTPTEEVLARVFAQVLEVEQVGVHDDFFELGGHSLLATQLIAQSLQEFQVELTVIDLFEFPTIAELAERIDNKQTLEQLQSFPVEREEEREEIEI